MHFLNCQNQTRDVELGLSRIKESDFPQYVEKVTALNKMHQEVNELFVLEASLKTHDQREVQILQNLLFKSNKVLHLVLDNHILLNTLQGVVVLIFRIFNKIDFTKLTLA